MSILLPAVLFGLASWQGYREALRESDLRVERTVSILREHAVKVFETQRLVIDQVNTRLRFMDWSSPADRSDVHDLMARLQSDLDQVATITATDGEGRLVASGRTFPADPTISFADRDWFAALKATDMKLPFVSKVYQGRQSGQPVFNLALRSYAPLPGFGGAVAVSVDTSYFEDFYRVVEPALESSVALLREDGQILARDPPAGAPELPADSELRRRMMQDDRGTFTARSDFDGSERFFGYSRVGDYPVFVAFAITWDAALATWRRNLIGYGIVAVLASMALLGVSLFAIRQAQRERLATLRWQAAAADLSAEATVRGEIEEQLRQSQKMEAVGQLTGGIAHDFNNLLTGIVGSLDLMQTRMAQGRTENLERYARAAMSSANRAAALTHRLLAFSRRQPLDPKPVDANALVTSLEDLLRRTLGEAIGLEIVTAGGLWPTLCDPHQLESALLNLAINARDAMPEGGRLTVETCNTHLDRAYAASHPEVRSGQYICICVTDTGTGMTPDVAARAFDPFFTTKPIGQGTGLGLSMIYGFARQSEGHAKIYSEVGHGTTVKIYLPRFRGEAAAPGLPDTPLARQAAAGRDETVLVVEDEPVVRDLVVEVVRDLGFHALEAADGPAGLALLQSDARIDLLVTDVGLPGLNGRQMAEAARATPDRSALKVLFITGYAENAALASGFLDPGMEMITKPFPVDTLATRIQAMIAKA